MGLYIDVHHSLPFPLYSPHIAFISHYTSDVLLHIYNQPTFNVSTDPGFALGQFTDINIDHFLLSLWIPLLAIYCNISQYTYDVSVHIYKKAIFNISPASRFALGSLSNQP